MKLYWMRNKLQFVSPPPISLRYTRFKSEPAYLVFNTSKGKVYADGNKIYGSQPLENNTTVYIYGETDLEPLKSGILNPGKGLQTSSPKQQNGEAIGLYFGDKATVVKLKYGISFISTDQAKKNLLREIKTFDLEYLKEKGRDIWNKTLNKIRVEGTDENDKAVFYTSLYRSHERPVNISEDGRYFSASDGKVHEDNGTPFFTDDWIWDTYRATHPLRILIDQQKESDILNSFIRMAEQTDNFWLPTFPEITGDSRRMNSNHGIVSMADAYSKGLKSFDLKKALKQVKRLCRKKHWRHGLEHPQAGSTIFIKSTVISRRWPWARKKLCLKLMRSKSVNPWRLH